MRSAKTLNLLAVAHNYKDQGKKAAVIKPALDTRTHKVWSRAGLEIEADAVISTPSQLNLDKFLDYHCLLVDEAHFLSSELVEYFRFISFKHDIPVICYGLRTDFLGNLFEGARRLFELADSIEEIKVTCQFCNKKAIFNMRLFGGKPTKEGPQVLVGDDDYVPTCYGCYFNRLGHPFTLECS